MAVPDHIRKILRPVCTVVEDNRRDGPSHYTVREWLSTLYIPGKTLSPAMARSSNQRGLYDHGNRDPADHQTYCNRYHLPYDRKGQQCRPAE